MLKKRNLRQWLQSKKWLWFPVGLIAFITLPFIWAATVLWEEKRDLLRAMKDAWLLMTFQVEGSEDE